MTVLAHPGRTGGGRTGGGLTGAGQLVRLAVRRDRIALPAVVYVIAALVAGTAEAFKRLYPTQAGAGRPGRHRRQQPRLALPVQPDLRGLPRLAHHLAVRDLGRPVRRAGGDLRGDQAHPVRRGGGRLELVGSAVVGRQAALAAALATSATASAGVTVLLCVLLPATGLPVAGSALLALAIGCCGLAFTGIAAVAAQLTSSARTARGIALGVLGVAFVLRGVGDAVGPSGPSWLSWLSPLGWIQFTQPFAAQDWWVLSLPLAVAAAGTGLAFELAARRDHGSGLLPDRPGPPAASAALRGPFGLAWRLQRGALAGWAVGYAFTFAACGAAAKGIGQLFGTSTALQREFARLGGQATITNAYLAALMLLAGLVAAAFAISTVLRLRTEETGGQAEAVLATATGRVRWALGHIAVAVGGAAALLAVAGVATGLGYGLRTGAAGPEAARMTGAALAQLPSVLVMAGVAVALFGLVPAASIAGAWTALGLVVVINLFGQVLQLSHWVLDISPFTHAPRLPGGPVSAAALAWLCGLALVLAVAGLAALRRRDIG